MLARSFKHEDTQEATLQKPSKVFIYVYVLQKSLLCITAIDLVPVDDLPEGLEMRGTAIAIVDVIGMLPYIHRQQRLKTLGDGVIGIGLLCDDELAVFVR